MTKLGDQLVEHIADATFRKTTENALQNALQNAPHIRHTVLELEPSSSELRPEAALVISAGPSLHIRNPAEKILASSFDGPIIAMDGSLGYCLRNGLVPDFVVCVDGHETRIVRWFGDPEMEQRAVDDHWQRQEMEPSQLPDGSQNNAELISLVNRYGPQIKMAIASSVHPSVTARVLQAGMSLYWWNPLYDDYNAPGSYSRQVHELNGAPCLVTGGNVGTSAWVFANAILKAKHVGLVGMDMGYEPGRPVEQTQYAVELFNLLGDRMNDAFIDVYNPYQKETWYCDPTYYWFRQSFLELAQQAPSPTYNCTEGGTLFGPGIEYIPLEQFLSKQSVTRP